MKALVTLLALSSISAFAADPSTETTTVARLLINNRTVVDTLDKENIDHLTAIESRSTTPGVTEYQLTFNRNCFCIPAKAVATITEDLRPTYRDGAPIYTSDLKIERK